MKLTKQMIEAAVYGGAVLGGGGGGWIDSGLEFGAIAMDYGNPQIVDIGDLPRDAVIITVAVVGAPAARERYLKPSDYVRAVEMLIDFSGERVDGIITNENGASATVNGWLQSAVLDIPVVDAPCNGRAHPISNMGAMGLTQVEDYTSIQAASGGNPKTGRKLELTVRGGIDHCSNIIRNLAVEAGGVVAVARNPVKAGYVAEKGSPGAIAQAVQVGEAMIGARHKGVEKVIRSAADSLSGGVVVQGKVVKVSLKTKGGFDVGEVVVEDGGTKYTMTFWNEYMTLDKGDLRIATFPDLIMTFSMENAAPLTTAEIRENQEIAIIQTHRDNLKLGAGMFDDQFYKRVEEAVGKPVLSYISSKGCFQKC